MLDEYHNSSRGVANDVAAAAAAGRSTRRCFCSESVNASYESKDNDKIQDQAADRCIHGCISF